MSSCVKTAVLVVLVVQNSALALFMRYSRANQTDGEQYATTTAVVMAELTKVLCSLLLQLRIDRGCRGLFNTLKMDIIEKPFDTIKMAIPAGLYVVQNNLAYIAVSNLDGPTYQLLYQLKILTTAMFSVAMLNRRLSLLQWASLVLLAAGVGMVQLSGQSKAEAVDENADAATGEEGGVAVAVVNESVNNVVGLVAVVLACCTSGFAGVYFEKVLKGSKVSLWIRNVQLAGYGLLFGLGGVYMKDWASVSTNGFFYKYDFSVWMAIALNSLGGLVVAMVVKYADNVVKGFATSISIVMTCIVSYFLFDFKVTSLFLVGACAVLYSTYMYGKKQSTDVATAPGGGDARKPGEARDVELGPVKGEDEKEGLLKGAESSDAVRETSAGTGGGGSSSMSASKHSPLMRKNSSSVTKLDK